MKSALFHEHIHDVKNQGGKDISHIDHAQVYDEQIMDKSFDGTTQDFKSRIEGALLLDLSLAYSSDKVQPNDISAIINDVNTKLQDDNIEIDAKIIINNDGNSTFNIP